MQVSKSGRSAPAAIGSVMVYNGPRIHSLNGRLPTKVENAETLLGITSSATSGAEVAGTINFNVRNATNLPWLSGFGQRYQKYRVLKCTIEFLSIVGTSTSGDIAIAILYDQSDTVTTPNIGQLLRTDGCKHSQIWNNMPAVEVDVRHFQQPWYLSGTTTGVASGNQQTPFMVAYSAQANATTTLLGRVLCKYIVEFVEPIDIAINT